MMLLTYATGVEIITIGNYLQGYIEVKMTDQIRQVTGVNIPLQQIEPTMVFFHVQGLAKVRTPDPNHFAYLRKLTDKGKKDDPMIGMEIETMTDTQPRESSKAIIVAAPSEELHHQKPLTT